MCGFGCYCFSGIRCCHQLSCGGGCGCSAVAVRFLCWPAAHAKCPLSHSPPAGMTAASPLCFSGPPQLIAAPLSSANDVSVARVVRTFYVAPSVKKKHLPLLFIKETSSLPSASSLPLWLLPVASQQRWLVNIGQELQLFIFLMRRKGGWRSNVKSSEPFHCVQR